MRKEGFTHTSSPPLVHQCPAGAGLSTERETNSNGSHVIKERERKGKNVCHPKNTCIIESAIGHLCYVCIC